MTFNTPASRQSVLRTSDGGLTQLCVLFWQVRNHDWQDQLASVLKPTSNGYRLYFSDLWDVSRKFSSLIPSFSRSEVSSVRPSSTGEMHAFPSHAWAGSTHPVHNEDLAHIQSLLEKFGCNCHRVKVAESPAEETSSYCF